MVRTRIVIFSFCALVLTGCSKSDNGAPPPPPASTSAPAPMAADGRADSAESVVVTAGRNAVSKPVTSGDRERQWMAYSHSMSLVMPPETVEPHFTHARDFCLQNTALDCILIAGTASAGDVNAQKAPSAQLTVTLPHDQVAIFQKNLLAPLAGQGKTDITVRQQSTQAENLTQQVTDIDRRASQLATYRDRLTTIAERPNLKADDLIPLEEKISELQSEIDQLASSKLTIIERVKRERLEITFASTVSISESARPVSHAWDESFEVFGNSASTVLLLGVAVLPWVPVAALIWLIVWLVRRSKRRRVAAAVPTTTSQGA